MNRLATLALAAALFAACGGGGTPPPTRPTIAETQTFTGTTRPTGPGSCGGDSHDFDAAEGTIAVMLVQSTGGVVVQVCAGGIDNNDCTIKLGPIAVGQTLSGTRKGIARQNLKLLPLDCVRPGPVPPGPVDYRATVTFQR